MAHPTDTIYVQVPAYRDPELGPTLLDLYASADDPGRLRTCVLWQRDDEELPDGVRRLPGLELIETSYRESRSANWARSVLQQRWDGEPFTMFIDSHHRFVPGWDALLLAMYRQCLARSPKPLLTAYLPAYTPSIDPLGRQQAPTRIYPLERESGVLARLTSYPLPFWTRLDEPVAGDFLSLHFVFAAGALNEEVRFDPGMYYLRDEVVTSTQAFTWGYDFFHPHRVVGWHCYDRGSRVPHWVDHEDWHVGHAEALDRMRGLFLGTAEPPPGYLGPVRSIAEYQARTMTPLVAT